MRSINSYLDLEVWIVARKLVKDVYNLTSKFPNHEMFGLISQMRRCVISIPSNIAEGCGRNHAKDGLQFYYISRGSMFEQETQLYLSFDLTYVTKEELTKTLACLELSRKLLSGFIKYYQSKK